MTYGLPNGSQIPYGATGFPQWVYQLGAAFNLKASTYPGHQEGQRAESGFAPNPQSLNRGIDWTGSVADMQRFAEYLLSVRKSLEQVIWENPNTGQRVGVAGGDDVTATAYYEADMAGHRDHVHTRQSAPIPLPGGTTVGWTGDPIWLENVLRKALGDRLVVHPGWEKRGTGTGVNGGNQMGSIWGVMIHHTGNADETPERIRDGVWQSATYFLPGPLSQCLITPDGKCHLVAIGPCNHAGAGSYPGIPAGSGNQVLIGFECAWPRDTSISPATQTRERWPDVQIITMRDASAAVVSELGFGSDRVIGHKEYAGEAQGKWDPGNLDMNWFRGEVAKAQRGDFKTIKPMDPAKPREFPRDYTDRQLLEWIANRLLAGKS